MSTADITAVEFETQTGLLLFTVKGQRFAYRGSSKPLDNYAADVAAGFATLAELRRATTATLQVEFSTDLSNPYRVNSVEGIAFHYDSLKP